MPTSSYWPLRERRQWQPPHLLVWRRDRRREKHLRADRRRSVEHLVLTPCAREPEPAGPPGADPADGRGIHVGERRGAERSSGAGAVDGRRQAVRREDLQRGRRDALGGNRMAAGLEQVCVRPDRDVIDRVAARPLDVVPGPSLTRAVLAVRRVQRLLRAAVEYHADDLPVTLVRLPEQVVRRVVVRVEVVVIEVPVLEHGLVRLAGDPPVEDAAWITRLLRVAVAGNAGGTIGR